MRKTGLGRGLSALMDEVAAASQLSSDAAPPVRLGIARIVPNPGQPRRQFDPEALAELAASIREHGVLQPILVRPAGERYEIVAGERRWRAAQQAGLHEMPVVVRDLDDRTTFEIALIENIQRADLNAIEEAEGYDRLIREFGYTPDRIAQAIGKSRPYVANLLRLLELPDNIRAMVVDRRLSASHARTIVSHLDATALAEKAAAHGWSVRQLEAAAKKAGPQVVVQPDSARQRSGGRDPNLVALEQSMADALGVAVDVLPGDEPWNGTVVVRYSDLQQLDMICQRLLGGTGRFD